MITPTVVVDALALRGLDPGEVFSYDGRIWLLASGIATADGTRPAVDLDEGLIVEVGDLEIVIRLEARIELS